NARCIRGNRLELAAVLGGRLGLEIKAVFLSKSSGEKDVNTCPLGRFPSSAGQSTQPQNVLRAQAEQSDRAGLQRGAPRNDGMLKGRVARIQLASHFFRFTLLLAASPSGLQALCY